MRLRFSIRDLFWLTLVVAFGLRWWLDHKWKDSPAYWVIERTNGQTIIHNCETGASIVMREGQTEYLARPMVLRDHY